MNSDTLSFPEANGEEGSGVHSLGVNKRFVGVLEQKCFRALYSRKCFPYWSLVVTIVFVNFYVALSVVGPH